MEEIKKDRIAEALGISRDREELIVKTVFDIGTKKETKTLSSIMEQAIKALNPTLVEAAYIGFITNNWIAFMKQQAEEIVQDIFNKTINKPKIKC